jgi:hypothetical protein
MAEVSKAYLRRVGKAALSHLSDADIERDPARAFLTALAAMRGVMGVTCPAPFPMETNPHG